MEATLQGNPKTIVNPICNDYYQLLEEILKLQFPPVVVVTTYASEHTMSRNVEATFQGNHKKKLPSFKCLLHVLNILGTEIWKPFFKGNHKTENFVYIIEL